MIIKLSARKRLRIRKSKKVLKFLKNPQKMLDKEENLSYNR